MSAAVRLARLAGLCLIFYACVAAENRDVTVQVGRRAVLTCDTSGVNYAYDTSWEKSDGTFLTRSRVYTIESVRMSDAGTYVCRIININDRSQVATTQLQLNVVPDSSSSVGAPIIDSSAQSSERLEIGGLIFRTCKVTDPNGGTWQYSWTYPDNRVVPTNILYIPSLQKYHSGTYKCVATSGSQRLETQFTFSPGAPLPAGLLLVKIRRISLRNPFILECYVEGSDAPFTYEWQKNGVYVTNTQRLSIKKVDASTKGSYECIVRGTGVSAGATGRTSDQVEVVMKASKSKISLEPPPGPIHVVDVGKSKELHCELDQDRMPPEQAQWFYYKQGERSIESSGKPVTIANGYQLYSNPSVSILVLTNLKMSDSGRYECVVQRAGKDDRREAYVVVVSDISLEVFPAKLEYTIGSRRHDPEFHCQVDNLPGGASSHVWTFIPNGGTEGPLPANAQLQKRPALLSTSFLTIKSPTVANAGNYICRVPGNYEGRGLLIVKAPRAPAVRLVVKPGLTVTVDPGMTARILCFEFEKKVVPEWRLPPGVEAQVTQETQGKNRILKFANVRPEQNGVKFTCSFNGQDPQEVTIRVNPGCPPGMRRCRSGNCIYASLFCNGRQDCPDGSDEDKSVCAKCEPNEVECQKYQGRDPVKKCIPVHWVCDGENDCGNGDDEKSCVVGVGCDKTLFQCTDGRRIPRGFRCDGEADCRDNDDEKSCSIPTVVIPSGGKSKTRSVFGGTELRLQCEALGISSPKIVWRYNWGFVTAKHTIDERCVNPNRYVSTLIISNIEVRDAGIYTCEALNNQGRAFGEDYIVDVSGP